MSEINFTINKEILKRYKAYGLSTEHIGSVIFILVGLYDEEYELLDLFDDGNKERQVLLLYHYLFRKGFIDLSNEDTIYVLTEKGVEFVNFVKSFQSVASATAKKVLTEPVTTKDKEETQDVSDWIEEWINLFPSRKFEGRYLRTNKLECTDRMRWFITTYGFDKNTIIKATRIYLQTQEQSPTGHTYTRNTSYFIFKGRSKHDRTSDLATWCQKVKDENLSEKEYIERDAV